MSEKKADLSRVFEPPTKSAYEVIQQAYEKVNSTIYVDGLTGCFNSKYLQKHIESFDPLRESESPTVLFFDLNHLKRENDTKGYEAGNRLITKMADVLKTSFLRKGDKIFRYFEGDEFVVICNENLDHPENQDNPIIKRLLDNTEKLNESRSTGETPLSFAFGVARFNDSIDTNLQDTISRASQEMKLNKAEMKIER